MDILFIQAGGTIDKGYPPTAKNHGYNFEIGEPAFLSTLERAKVRFSWNHTMAVKKDSCDMTDGDRAVIRAAVARAPNSRVVITHGTDTILETARVLVQIPDKTIVLTGAMVPEKFKDSDADFNLGLAVGAVGRMSPGVYIALHGEVKLWSNYK